MNRKWYYQIRRIFESIVKVDTQHIINIHASKRNVRVTFQDRSKNLNLMLKWD